MVACICLYCRLLNRHPQAGIIHRVPASLINEPLNRKALDLRWTPHPVIVTIMDNRDCIRVLVYPYYTTITGWGVLLT